MFAFSGPVASAINVAATAKNIIQETRHPVSGKNAPQMIADFNRSDSLVSYTKNCRVEPITIVDERLMFQPYLSDILQTANSIFAGYYLQALAIDSVVGSVKVMQKLDKLSPKRSPFMYTTEDFKDGLPKFNKDQTSLEDNAKKEINATYNGAGDLKQLRDVTNLAIGKIFEAKFKYNEQEFSLPIAIRLAIKSVDPKSLVHILGIGKDNKSAKSRYHGWKSGELEFWRDIVMCEDLIKAHRDTMAKDKSGIYAEIMGRRAVNQLAAAVSGEASVGSASAIAIVSDATRKEVEYEIGGKFSDYRTRKRIFDDTYLMLMFVVDTEYEHVTIYHRGIESSTDMSVKEVKMASKGDGPNVADILKAYISGHAPSL